MTLLPGVFNGSATVDAAGLTVQAADNADVTVNASETAFTVAAPDATLDGFTIAPTSDTAINGTSLDGDLTVTDVRIEDAGDYGIEVIGAGAENVTVTNTVVESAVTSGVRIDGSGDAILRNNTAESISSSSGFAVNDLHGSMRPTTLLALPAPTAFS
ncbi:MAG: hypothetical protein J07HX64_02892 [halophilic archaeon J07HX64]|nr:MAG: hypothetical protein J07HX64_02892 [halophilic archaeon J07HX64]